MSINPTNFSDHQRHGSKDSYSKIHTPIKRKLSEYVIQKQSSYAQIHKPERQKQKSTPDILQLLKKYQKCHTNQSQHQPPQQKDNVSNQEIKKHKTVHNNDASPIRVSQEALPLKNIVINRKRPSVSDRDTTLLKLQELKKKIQEKVPNPLEILGPETNPISNRITFQASLQTEESKLIQKTVDTPGTAQFMQSNRDDNIQEPRNPFERNNSFQDIQIMDNQISLQKNLDFFFGKRKPSCCEDNFKPVQKTQQLAKPYFESNKGEDIQNNNFTNRLECRKIMIILDQDKEKILDQIALNPIEIHNSPTSSVWDKALKIDRLDEQLGKQKTEESLSIKCQQIRSKRGSIKNENTPYWKLRDLELKKKNK
ncbi:unnamed protein product [Paramecium primaurelia]|uniref:Uncharacterized protein n=3 Tax=Paramecium TaxID=5884 RepID=A0A8S1WH97_9CILI|nr:unnamed protein product [Paramecium primaurelia]CAD8188341.1 unnamed protein product [Paramecium pentaurelia]